MRFLRSLLAPREVPMRDRVGGRISINELVLRSNECYHVLQQVKRETPLNGQSYYPYDSFGNIPRLHNLLEQAGLTVAETFELGPVLDLCCGDGDLSFLFESLGYDVTAVDLPSTNFNQMQGVRAMKGALNARVRIEQLDLNTATAMPAPFYRMGLFLGGLYHLKNPFLVLETLARHCAWCFLSTRVTRLAADRQTDISALPVAYLLGESESNQDATNFWILSHAGMRVLLARTGWHIRAVKYVGDTETSDPATLEGDERGFYLLESGFWAGRRPAPITVAEPGEGWHPVEDDSWRWVARRFTLRLHSFSRKPELLALRFEIPEVIGDSLCPITLTCRANGVTLPSATYMDAGNYMYATDLPRRLRNAKELRLEFTVDKSLPPDAGDPRDRAIVIRMESLAEALR